MGCQGAKTFERGACLSPQVVFHHLDIQHKHYCDGCILQYFWIANNPLFSPLVEPHSVELKGVGPGLVGVSERSTGESNVGQLTRPRAFSQSAMHSLERGDRGNTQALAELAQVLEEHSS